MSTARPAPDPGPTLDRRFRDAMGSVAAPVSVVTTLVDGRPHGTTVSAFASLSMDPPMLLVSLHRASRLLSYVQVGTVLGVDVLASDQAAVAARFAVSGEDKFDGVAWTSADGAPALEGVHARVTIAAASLVEAGDHVVVLGDVVAVAPVRPDTRPLTYHRKTFGTHHDAATDPL